MPRLQTIPRHELPACKIQMIRQIFFPRILYSWLKGQNQHLLPAHFLCQLIGSERLAETHFCVPQKVRCFIGILRAEALEIFNGFIHCRLLFGPHGKIQRTLVDIYLACFDFYNRRLHRCQIALKPFAIDALDLLAHQHAMHLVVGEEATIVTQGYFVQLDFVRLTGQVDGILFRDARLCGFRGVTDF